MELLGISQKPMMPDLYLPFKEMEHLSDIEVIDKKQAIADRKERRQ